MLTLGRSLEEEGWVVKAAGGEEEGAEGEAVEVEAGALAVAELNPLSLFCNISLNSIHGESFVYNL